MAGGLRISELTHLRCRDLDLAAAELTVAASKTAAGQRRVVLEPELAQLLHEHKLTSKWSQLDDFVFPGKYRDKPRECNSLRKRALYETIERANERLVTEGKQPIPEGITFHPLRRTYAALRAELGEHPAITAAQRGHRDPRMTLRVYTDVTGMEPKTRMAGVLGDADWALTGTRNAAETESEEEADSSDSAENLELAGTSRASTSGSDGTRTRGLRRDRPAL
jgi:integrase